MVYTYTYVHITTNIYTYTPNILSDKGMNYSGFIGDVTATASFFFFFLGWVWVGGWGGIPQAI